ncbi:hypothetical protein MtrunA17_Chr2g0299931 [Medicago truncatula]|uniref:Uncharacterized protein n=1 Tax=Medicago truncatula TaxID=3880 RepID=A0A396J8A1_MEDTR|nr:hypothetical protein MtrunA17_Chr2g0299931 [Medicago truncatula]
MERSKTNYNLCIFMAEPRLLEECSKWKEAKQITTYASSWQSQGKPQQSYASS